MNESATSLIYQALEQDKIIDLLLGAPGYRYLPKYSSASSTTDLAALLGILYDTCPKEKRPEVASKLEKAVRNIVKRYEGIIPSATVILIEALEQKKGDCSLGLPLESLASDLRNSIKIFQEQLANDRTIEGKDWQDGLLGELKRLSKNTSELGGPSFC